MSHEPKIQYCLLNILDVLYAFVLFSPFAPQFVIMNSPVRSLPSFLCLLSHTRIHQMLHFIYQLHCHSTVRDFKLLFGPLKFFCGGWESFQAQTFVKWFSISNVVLKKSSARFANSTPLSIFSPSPRNMIHLHRRCWEWLSANTPLHMWERPRRQPPFQVAGISRRVWHVKLPVSQLTSPSAFLKVSQALNYLWILLFTNL